MRFLTDRWALPLTKGMISIGVVMMSWSSSSRILEGGLLLPAQALFEPERIPLKLDNMATVGETVQQRRGESGITEDLSPAGEV